jgi:hypothetical protein
MDFCPDLNEKQARGVIRTWIKNGVLIERGYEDPKERRPVKGLFVGKRAG